MSVVAIDCEMVASGNQDLLARVSIVNEQGSVLLDKYVKPTAVVTDYRTCFSGITKADLDSGESFSAVQENVLHLLKGKILVGHSLQKDLNALGLSNPECNRRDLATYGPYMRNGQPQSLKHLAQIHLNTTIQEGEHDSVTDARTAMQLYNRVANNWN